MKTIIFSHPWDKSFNQIILDNITKEFTKKNINYTVIDLYKDKFNPIMYKEDLELFSKGETLDPLVKKYQNIIKQSDELIFIFPIWWSNMPAMLKGFFDKVYLKNFAYTETKIGIKGLFHNIKNIKVITTSTSPKLYIRFLGTINWLFKIGIGKFTGIKKFKWFHFSFAIQNTNEKREKRLEKMKKFILK